MMDQVEGKVLKLMPSQEVVVGEAEVLQVFALSGGKKVPAPSALCNHRGTCPLSSYSVGPPRPSSLTRGQGAANIRPRLLPVEQRASVGELRSSFLCGRHGTDTPRAALRVALQRCRGSSPARVSRRAWSPPMPWHE